MVSLYGLARALGPRQPLYLLDLHAFGATAAARDSLSMASVATRMIEDMRRIQPLGPYHLVGYSLGGRIVYDAARQLLACGQAVGLLALLDCRAPGSDGLHRFGKRVQLHVRFGLALGALGAARYLGQRIWNLRRYMRRPVDTVPVPVFDYASQYAGVPDLPSDQLEARRLSTDALLAAWAGYVAMPISARMLLIRAIPPMLGADVRQGVESDLSIGWDRGQVSGLDVEVLGCAHGEMFMPTQSRKLAMMLAKYLPPDVIDAPAGQQAGQARQAECQP